MKRPATLFLHGGPGLSSIAEGAWYGDSLDVHWWDQPRFDASSKRPYRALLDDAERQAQVLINLTDNKINLLAHSFGARLALHLAVLMPDRIGAITLMAPAFNVADAFVRLAECVDAFAPDPDRLRTAAGRARQQDASFADVWSLIEAVSEVPTFLNAYWGADSDEQRQRFYALIAEKPWADFNTCKVILKDFWSTSAVDVQPSVTAPVKLLFGVHDVLVDANTEERIWLRYFPHATTQRVNSGHCVQFETPPTVWMP